MSDPPIGDHAFLSDCHSSALVATDGWAEWLTFPRFDSPSICARRLDDEAGHFRVGIGGGPAVTRRYIDGSRVLETTFRTEDGTLRLTDALCIGSGERGHELTRDARMRCCATPSASRVTSGSRWSSCPDRSRG